MKLLQALLRRLLRPAERSVSRPVVEACEPKLLFSADPLGLYGALAANAEVRLADPAPTVPPQIAQQQTKASEIAFVDTQVADYQRLVDDLQSQAAKGRPIEVHLINAGQDGIQQISDVLRGRSDVGAVHIFSHGVGGAVELGSAWLNAYSLDARAAEVSSWGAALSHDADILLYGCDVAANGQGQSFIDRLAEITGADVAASRDATGSTANNANWTLEYARGSVDTANGLSAALQYSYAEVLAITVGNTSSADTTNVGAATLTWSHTVASGSNGILIVEIATKAKNHSVTTVTYGGVALTFLGASQYAGGDDTRAEMWYLKAPVTGTANIVVSTSASSAFAAGATNFYGVDQTTPTGTAVAASNSNSTPTVTVASAAGELVIDTLAARSATSGSASVGAGQTQLFQRSSGGGGGDQFASGSTEAGAASVTMSWALGGSTEYAIVAVALKPAASSASPVIANLAGDSLSYLPNSGAVLLDQGGNAAVTDSDSPTFNGGALTVSFASGSDPAEDVLAIRNQGSGAGQIGVSGANVTYAGTVIGTFTGGSAGADLLITLNASSNTTNTTALLRNITFQDTDTIGASGGARSVRFVLSDGAGGVSATNDVTVNVQAATPFIVTGSYGGNGLDNRAITGLGFTPDVVIIKARNDKQVAVIRTSTMVGDASKELTGTNALKADEIQSLDADGFTIGTDSTVNKGARTYDWIAFKASPGFLTLGTYAGNGAASQSVTGLAFSPDALFVFDAGNEEAVHTNSAAGGNAFNFNDTTNAGWIPSLGANGFTVGADNRVNDLGRSYHYIAWNEIAGLMDVGSYAGNGVDNRNISGLGLTPQWVVVKDTAGGKVAQHFASQGTATDSSSYFTGSAATTDLIQALQPDGFQVGTDSKVNATGKTYTYMAWRTQAAPVIANLDGDALSYVPGSSASVLDQGGNASVTDSDSADFSGGTLTVSFASGNDPAKDVLAIRNEGPGAGQIGLSGANGVTYGGTLIGSWSGGSGGANLVVTFNANADATSAGALLRNVTFRNTDPVSPTAGPRDVRFVLTDGDGGTSAASSVTATVSNATPYIISGSYTGNAADNRVISGLSFRPDVVIIKARDTNEVQVIRTSTMTGDLTKEMVGGTALVANEIQSLDADGFTIGTDATVNASAKIYDWIAFKASPGFLNIGSYTGNGSAGRSITGLELAPDALFIFDTGNEEAVFTHSAAGGVDFNFDNSSNANWITALDAGGFTLGSDNRVNGSGRTYHYIAWHEIAGLMDVGSYAGNNTDNRNVTGVGFQPEWVVVRDTAGDNVAQHFDSQGAGTDSSSLFTASSATTNRIQALQADGFQVGTDADVNASGQTYTWMAFRQETAPTLTDIVDRGILEDGTTGAVAFTVGDTETAAGSLTVTATSTNQALVPNANIVLGGSGASRTLTVTPVANQNGPVTISVSVNDGFASSTDTFVLTITSVNDAPVGTGNTVVTLEDTAYVFGALDFGLVDPSDAVSLGGANALANVKFTTLPGAGSLRLSGVAVSAGQFVPAANITAGDLVFTPAANATGTAYTSFSFQVQDDGGTANGGVDLDPTPRTMSVDVTAVDDAPLLDANKSPALGAINEDAGAPSGAVGTLVSALVDFASPAGQVDNVSDPDAGALLGIAVTAADTSSGSWWYSSDGGSNWNALGAVSNTSARLLAADANTRLYFQPNANVNGTFAAAITLRAWDRTSGSNGALADTSTNGGTTAFSSATDTASQVVTAVNDAPTATIAQASGGSEVRVNTTTAGSQASPSIALDADGDYVVVWSGSGSGDAAGIFGQRYGADGVARGAEFRVNTTTANTQTRPAVASDAGGNFVVVWDSDLQDGSGRGIYAQRFDRDGVALGAEFRVNTYTAGEQKHAAVAMDADGDFVIVWDSDAQDGDGKGIYGQRYAADGSAAGAEFLVNSTTAGGQSTPAVAIDADGDFVVAWNGSGSGDAGGVFARRYNAAGVAQGAEFLLNTTTANTQNKVDIEMDALGNFVAVWSGTAQDPDASTGVYGQRFAAGGAALGSEFRVNTTLADSQTGPEVAVAADGQFVVVWESNLQDGSLNGVYRQAYSAAGVAQGGESRVNTTSANDQAAPSVDMADDGRHVVVWSGEGVGDVDGVFTRSSASGYSATEQVALLLHGTGIAIADADAGAASVQATLTVASGTLSASAGSTGVTIGGSGSASLTLAGSVAQINALLAGNLGATLSYLNALDAPPASDTLTLTVNDLGNTGSGGSLSGTSTATIAIVAVNDAPAVTSTGGALAYTENAGALAVDAALSVGDADSTTLAGATVTISANYVNGQDLLAFTNQNGISGSWNAGSGTLTLSGAATVADYQTALRSVTYANGSDNPSTTARTVSFIVNDGALSSSAGTRGISVSAVNDAPLLDANKSPALTAVNEDAGAPVGAVGTLVSALVDFAVPAGQVDNVTDTDAGAQLGVAVTAADTTSGAWWYSTDNGSNWLALGAVSNGNARLLSADASTRLTFAPNANYSGTLATALTVRAWDRSTGSNGALADTSSNGGDTAFSAATDTVSQAVNAVADTPSVSNATTNEDTQTSSGLVITRNAADGAEVTHFQITGISNGTLFQNDGSTAISNGAFITVAQGNAGLKFTPVANFNGSGGFTVQASTSNVVGGLGGGTVNATITVTAVNDAPVVTSDGGAAGASVNVAENSTAVTTVTSSDVDGGTAVYTIAGGADQTLFTINTSTGALSFIAAPNFETPADAGANNVYDVTVQVSDGAGGSDTQNIAVTVTNVNEAPVNTVPGAQTVNEDTALVISGVSVGDVDDNLATLRLTVGSGTVSVSLAGGATISTGANASATLTLAGTQAQINAALAAITYQGSANFNGSDTLTVLATDGSGATDSDTVAIPVTAVNDAPVVATTGGALAYTENQAATAVDSGLTVSDVDNANLASATVQITGNYASGEDVLAFANVGMGNVAGVWNSGTGTLTLTSAGSTATMVEWQAALRAVSYANSSDNPGTAARTISYTVNDGALVSNTVTSTVNVTAVNDAPTATITPASYAASEQVALALHGTGLSIADVDAGAAVVRATVSATSGILAAAAGTTGVTVTGSGTASVTLDGTLTQINNLLAGALSGTLTYTANSNTPAPSDTLTLSASDLGNTGTGGTLTGNDTATINITAVNDAPTGSVIIDDTTPSQGQTLTASNTLSDVDGPGVISYQWQRGGVDIVGATGATYVTSQADVGAVLRVVASYTDGHGAAESVTSAPTASVAKVNDAPTGLPLVQGTATEDQTLTADTTGIADADGLGAYSYQWLRDGVAVVGATASTYTLGDADVGTQISVRVDYIDGQGTPESLASAPTAPITNLNDAPVLAAGADLVFTAITEDDASPAGQSVAALLASAGAGTITDVDTGALQGVALVALDAGNGRWQFSADGGSTWADAGAVSGTQALLLRDVDWLRLLPDGRNGTLGTLQLHAWDQTTGSTGSRADTTISGGLSAFSSGLRGATLAVTAVNDAPSINTGTASIDLVVDENGTSVVTLSADDVDLPAQGLVWSLAGGADAGQFTVDAVSGDLRFVQAPDFERGLAAGAGGMYEVQLRVSDAEGAADERLVRVAVANVNEAPLLGLAGDVSLTERPANGTPLLQLQASDTDAGDSLVFTLVDDAGGRFALDVQTGRVVVADGTRIDHTASSELTIVVRVTDAQGLSDERALRIAVLAQASAPNVPAPPEIVWPDLEMVQPPPPVDSDGRERPAQGASEALAVAPVPLPLSLEGADTLALRVDVGSFETDALSTGRDLIAGGASRSAQAIGAAETVIPGVNFDFSPSALVDVALDTFSTVADLIARSWAGGGRSGSVGESADDDGLLQRPADTTKDGFIGGLIEPASITGVSVTAGFVWWLTRGGGMLTTVLMGVPAWRHIDLLPVMARELDDEDDDENGAADDADEESDLNGMFDRKARTAGDKGPSR